MPIGCAGAIRRGVTFEEFVLQAAAMLAPQLGLDNPVAVQGADFPLAAELAEARAYLAELEAMDEAAAQLACDADYAQQRAEWEAGQRAKIELRQRYEEVLKRLEAWTPEFPSHRAFKSRLMEDLGLSIACDCCKSERVPIRMGHFEWRIQKMVEQTLRISHIERRSAHCLVMDALRQSLGIESDAPI